MEQISFKFLICSTLIIGSLLAVPPRAGGNQGHHQSGVVGRVRVEQTVPPLLWQVRVSTDTCQSVTVLQTDADGQFIINLKPGAYRLTPFYPVMFLGEWTELAGPSVPVTVPKKDFTVVELSLTW